MASVSTALAMALSAIRIGMNHSFTDDIARNAYFASKPTELKSGIYVQSGGKLQQWNGTSWSDTSTLIKGDKGDTGANGINGVNGTNGLNGQDGLDGIGISGIVDNGNNTFTITLTDGTSHIITKVDLSTLNSDDLTQGATNLFMTSSERNTMVNLKPVATSGDYNDLINKPTLTTNLSSLTDTTVTTPTQGQALTYDTASSKWVNTSIVSDGKVKATSTATAEYLDTIVDGTTIIIDGDNLVVKKIDGQTVTIAEINTLQGMTGNVKSILDSLASAGMTYTGIVNTKADLNAVVGMVTGNVKIVLVDETQSNKRMAYIYSGTIWESVGESNITIRDFSVNPINLTSEVTGILPQDKVDLTGIAKITDLSNYTTTTDLATNYATKIDLGAKANSADVYLKTETYSKSEVYNKTETYSQIETYNQTQVTTALDGKVDKVTGKSLVSDTEITKLQNITGTNTGDETVDTIKTKLGYASATADGYLKKEDFVTFSNNTGGGSGKIETWTPNMDWTKDSGVVYNEKLYQVLNNILNSTISPDLDPTNFLPISGSDLTASNIGGGAKVYNQTVDHDMQFKTIKAGSNTVVTETVDGVYISATITGNANASVDYGTASSGGFDYDTNYIAFNTTNVLLKDTGTPDTNTKCLIHADGTNGATTFTDANGRTYARGGTAVLSSTQKKFGTTALYAPNTASSDYFSTATNLTDFDFGTGDFTIDFWLYPTGYGQGGSWGGYISTGNGANTTGNSWIVRYKETTHKITFNWNSAGTNNYFDMNSVVPLNIWSHLAFCRQGDNLRIYFNGILDATHTGFSTRAINGSGLGLYLFRSWSSTYPQYDGQGYMDEVRICKGVAKYVANFTPNTSPYGFYNTTQYNQVKVKSTQLLDAAQFYQINGITITQYTPLNTDIKWALDTGATNPKVWSGGTWIDCTDISTQGMSKSAIETALTNYAWNELGTKFGLVCALKTADASTTPTVDNVAINYLASPNTLDGHIINDSTKTYTQRANLKFTGTGVTVSDDSANDSTVVNITGSTGLPTGGTTNQILTKNSSTDGDASWKNAPTGSGLEEWIGGTSYTVGKYVVNSNKIYKCTTANSDATFTLSKWQYIGINTATDIGYTNTTSGLTATNVQTAIDETVTKTNTALTKVASIDLRSQIGAELNYGRFYLTTAIDNPVVNSTVIPLKGANYNNGITHNTTTGTITLNYGKTYRLSGWAYITGNSDTATFALRDVATKAMIYSFSVDADTINGGYIGDAKQISIYKPTKDIELELFFYYTASGTVTQIYQNTTHILVEETGRTLIASSPLEYGTFNLTTETTTASDLVSGKLVQFNTQTDGNMEFGTTPFTVKLKANKHYRICCGINALGSTGTCRLIGKLKNITNGTYLHGYYSEFSVTETTFFINNNNMNISYTPTSDCEIGFELGSEMGTSPYILTKIYSNPNTYLSITEVGRAVVPMEGINETVLFSGSANAISTYTLTESYLNFKQLLIFSQGSTGANPPTKITTVISNLSSILTTDNFYIKDNYDSGATNFLYNILLKFPSVTQFQIARNTITGWDLAKITKIVGIK